MGIVNAVMKSCSLNKLEAVEVIAINIFDAKNRIALGDSVESVINETLDILGLNSDYAEIVAAKLY